MSLTIFSFLQHAPGLITPEFIEPEFRKYKQRVDAFSVNPGQVVFEVDEYALANMTDSLLQLPGSKYCPAHDGPMAAAMQMPEWLHQRDL